MPDNANMTKVNWSGDDIDVLNVDEKSGLVTVQKEGCSDVRAVADYTDPTVFDPVMASVHVCVSELDKDEIAVNHLRVDMEEGETVTLQAVASREVQGCHPARWNCDNGGDNRRCEVCEAGANAPAPWVEHQPAPDPQPAPAPMGAWVMDSVGWWYRNADGSYPTNTSMVIDGRTYRFDGRGYMRTGWVLDGGAWYYHDASGAQLTGWVLVDGSWYYLHGSGVWVA